MLLEQYNQALRSRTVVLMDRPQSAVGLSSSLSTSYTSCVRQDKKRPKYLLCELGEEP